MSNFLLRGVLLVLFLACGTNATLSYPTSQEYAINEAAPGSYYGVKMTMDVYGLSLTSREQVSYATVWIINDGSGSVTSTSYIEIGWMVSPFYYRDSRTHLFSVWTNDGSITTGCLNMNCPGFQRVSGSTIAPGDVIGHVSQPKGIKQSITIKVLKDGGSRDWLVYYGLNQDHPPLIGRFPKSLFPNGLADRATRIRIGGVVVGRSTKLSPMGSGYLPTGNPDAASIRNIQLFDQNGRATTVSWDPFPYMTQAVTYAATPIVNGKFFYGGPLLPTA